MSAALRAIPMERSMIQRLPQHFPTENEYVDTQGLEELTKISASTWAKRRLSGDTPPFIKVGRSVLYHVPTAKAWLARRTRRSTSDFGDGANIPASAGPAMNGAASHPPNSTRCDPGERV